MDSVIKGVSKMGPISSIAAGLAAAVGVIAVMRFAEQRRARRKGTLDMRGDGVAPKAILEFERDQASGVYRAK